MNPSVGCAAEFTALMCNQCLQRLPPVLLARQTVPAVAAVLRGSTSIQCRMRSDSPAGLLAGLRRRRLEFFVGLVPDGQKLVGFAEELR